MATMYTSNKGYSTSYEEMSPIELNANTLENYKMKIMEKDKALFESARTRREQEKIIETLRRELELKEENIEQLKLQLDEMSFNLHQYETILSKNTGDMNELQRRSEEQLTSLNDQRASLLKKNEELEKVLASTQENIKTSFQEYQSLEKDNLILKDTINDKLSIISKYEGIFDQLKKDNKQIPSLKRKIIDLESILDKYKSEINTLKDKNDRLQNDKDETDSRLKIAMNENQKEKLNSQNIYKLNFEIENLRKDYSNKEKENLNLIEKYKSTLKDSDNFVHIVTCEIGQFTNHLESLNTSTKTLMKMPLSSIKSFTSTGIGNSFSLKYEVIMKSIELLKTKTIELLNSDLISINKLTASLAENEAKLKRFLSEKESSQKDNAILRHKLNEAETQTRDMKNSLDALNESYNKLKDNYLKLKQNYKEYSDKHETINKETQDFIITLHSKLIKEDNQGFNNNNDTVMTSNKIIERVSNLLMENSQLKNEVVELKNKNDKMKENMTQLIEENNDIKNQNSLLEQSTNEKLNHIESTKDTELKQQKDILYDKIKSLTQLLEQSNQLILTYEKEVKEHKARNAKLENNLKMLTNSHLELEQNINHNNSTLHSEIEEKDQKYNSLLREIELKDIHIQSLEKLLNSHNIQHEQLIQPSQNLVGKILRNTQQSQYMIPQQYQEEESNASSFIKNEDHEQELKKLMSCFNSTDNTINFNNNTIDPYNNVNTTEPKADECINNNVINNNNRRIPGKLYSTKRK